MGEFMATQRQSLIPGWMLPGALAASLLVVLAITTLTALLWQHSEQSCLTLLGDPWLWHVIGFSFNQALLSTLLSVAPAIVVARTLWRCHFPGREWLLRLCSVTLVMPVLVVVFGILSVYGRQGWIAQIAALSGFDWDFSPYGLHGILLAHVFFNLPLSARLLLQTLERIPNEQRQLAAQLSITGWNHFRLVEWPWLRRQLLSCSMLVFMLCFASFAIVLTLGGGPQATTLDLAIYQALSYDYDPHQAAFLALLQLFCYTGFVLISQRLSKGVPVDESLGGCWRNRQQPLGQRLADILVILLTLLLLLPPLLAVVINGIHHSTTTVLTHHTLWIALLTSLRIAIGAAVVSVILTLMLLWSSRELRLRQRILPSQLLEMSGMLILAMPSIVLASGVFLLLNFTIGLPQSIAGLVIMINALMAIPFVMKVLEHPMLEIAERYNLLCLSLNIHGWNRLRLIELRALRRPLTQALAFAATLSIGDFGMMALFGNNDFITLPFYLYQQLGAYRSDDGAVTALMLLILCLLLFTLIEKVTHPYANTH